MSLIQEAARDVSSSAHRLGDSCKIILPHCTNQKIWCAEHRQYHRIEDDEYLQIGVRRKSSLLKKTTRSLKNAVLPRRASKESPKPVSNNSSPMPRFEMEHVPIGNEKPYVEKARGFPPTSQNPRIPHDDPDSNGHASYALELHDEHINELYTSDVAAAELEQVEVTPSHVSPAQCTPIEPPCDHFRFATPQKRVSTKPESLISPSISRKSTENSVFSHGGSVDTGLTPFSSRSTSQIYDQVAEPSPSSAILSSNDEFDRMFIDADYCPSPPCEPIREDLTSDDCVVPDLDLRSPVSPLSRSSTYGMFPGSLTDCNSGLQTFGQQESWEWAASFSSGLVPQTHDTWNVEPELAAASNASSFRELDNNGSGCQNIFEMPDSSCGPTMWNIQHSSSHENFASEMFEDPYCDMLQPVGHQNLDEGAGHKSLDQNATSSVDFGTAQARSFPLNTNVGTQRCTSANSVPTSTNILKRKPVHPQTQQGKSRRRPSYSRRSSLFNQPHSHGTHPYEPSENSMSRRQPSMQLICDQCDYEPKGSDANKRTNLRRHKKSVHSINGEVCIPCARCPATFNRSDNVIAHAKRYHPEQTESMIS